MTGSRRINRLKFGPRRAFCLVEVTKMTAKQLSYMIGEEALYSINKIEVAVSVVDARFVYGRPQFQITPLRGAGMVWVDASSIVFNPAPGSPKKINLQLQEVNNVVSN